MKAMILAAGRGERMRPLTDHQPKPLLSVGGKPLIQHHIEKLKAAGITDLVINHAWLGYKLVEYLGNGSALGVTIHWSAEGESGLETAGGIRQALALFGDEPFLVINGDIWLDTDYELFSSYTLSGQDHAHLWLVDNPPHHPEGDFSLQGDRVEDIPGLTFSGVGVYRPAVFFSLQPGVHKLAPLLRQWMSEQRVAGSYLKADWRDIGTPQRLYELDQALQRGQHAG
ncbi:N-acetylmuramate alpha-1-phosphate uridylyltransferase MurU [Tolumonas lignilytica]|uniref:N-acetylmuramate alpha-1-phosphate uridylyltransferase MurU n=1 Tax=Tolumonas lignilytica TaxID=1283284 RepID=UPI000463D617|nr:nucleotidyltransferase family protein [Tolumonas lignilytica]